VRTTSPDRTHLQGESGVLEFEIVGLKGTHRWLETHAVPLRDENQNITALLAVARDVTQRKQTEQLFANYTPCATGCPTNGSVMESEVALRHREQELRLITDALPFVSAM